MASGDRLSSLLLEEYFASGDARFLDSLRSVSDPRKLAPIVDRWKKDPRPWAREQIFAYLDLPLDARGHQVVVKRLFKQAEENRDDELMAAFMVAFDRLVRRYRKKVRRWDYAARMSYTAEELATPNDAIPGLTQAVRKRWAPAAQLAYHANYGQWSRTSLRLFTYKTRHYLRRRAWRYFRRMGFQQKAKYPGAVGAALRRYRDEDLASGVNILDCWGLMSCCFQHHPALAFRAGRVNLADGHGLGELSPAPYFAPLWEAPAAAPVLIDLVLAAGSRLVRVWAMQLLRAHHAATLTSEGVDLVLRLLNHPDPEAQQFGAELLETTPGLDRLSIESWLKLLETTNVTALETIAQVMQRHVTADRVDLAQAVDLASARPAPVARMGLQFLRAKRAQSPRDRETVARLAMAQCLAVARDIAAWALGVIGAAGAYDVDHVTPFFDSLLAEVRDGAWAWLTPESAGYDDPALWSRLLETPYEDLRLRIVDLLAVRASLPGGGADALVPLWCSVLLGVHRGGRQKARAVAQLSSAIRRDPATADLLLPVLAVAIRSVRPAEARPALAAVVGAVERRPELADAVRRHLPELVLLDEGVTL